MDFNTNFKKLFSMITLLSSIISASPKIDVTNLLYHSNNHLWKYSKKSMQFSISNYQFSNPSFLNSNSISNSTSNLNSSLTSRLTTNSSNYNTLDDEMSGNKYFGFVLQGETNLSRKDSEIVLKPTRKVSSKSSNKLDNWNNINISKINNINNIDNKSSIDNINENNNTNPLDNIGLIYNISLNDNQENIKKYFEGSHNVFNTKGEVGIGLRIGNYDSNFSRIEFHGERTGLLNNIIGVDFSSNYKNNALNFFTNQKSDDNSTTVKTITNVNDRIIRTRTQTDNIKNLNDQGMEVWLNLDFLKPDEKHLKNQFKIGVSLEETLKKTVQAQTVEIWTNNYSVTPIEGKKTNEKTSLIGFEFKSLLKSLNKNGVNQNGVNQNEVKNYKGLNSSISLIQNNLDFFERENIEVNDTTYKNIWSHSVEKNKKNWLVGLGLNNKNQGFNLMLGNNSNSEFSPNMLLYKIVQNNIFSNAIFLNYYGVNKEAKATITIITNSEQKQLDMLVENETMKFMEETKDQYRNVLSIKNIDRIIFEREQTNSYSNLNKNLFMLQFSYQNNNPAGLNNMEESGTNSTMNLRIYCTGKHLMGGLNLKMSEENSLTTIGINSQIALKLNKYFTALGFNQKTIFDEDLKINRMTYFEGGIYF